MRVGIIGAGQLGRMMALAGYPIGVRTTFLDFDPESSGAQVAPTIVGAIDDVARIRELAEQSDVVTFDIENVPVEALSAGTAGVPIFPPPKALAVAQDRLNEKHLFQSVGAATAPYLPIEKLDDLRAVGDRLGWPIVLKARRLGYDGRGQRIVNAPADLEPAWRDLGSVPALAEGWVDFEREVSLIAVRGADASTAYYPLSENVHVDGILHSTTAPYRDSTLQADAEAYLDSMLDALDYRGVLTVEFFVTGRRLIANEIAPRVHNSGHWTIEGAATSQFENHLRAILGLPLGETAPLGHAFMLNLLGALPPREKLLQVAGLHLHDYGKTPRPKRKIGHCTLVAGNETTLADRIAELQSAIGSRL